MSNPFDYVKAITETKQDLMTGSANDKMVEKEYDPFLTNRALSHYPDTILLANEMNQRPFMRKKMQFHFFLNIVKPRKRYSEWHKKEKSGDLDIVKQYYNYNNAKAKSALSILTAEQLDDIKRKMQTGG